MSKYSCKHQKMVEAMPHEIVDTAISCGKLMKKRHLWCQWCGLRGDVLKFENENQ